MHCGHTLVWRIKAWRNYPTSNSRHKCGEKSSFSFEEVKAKKDSVTTLGKSLAIANERYQAEYKTSTYSSLVNNLFDIKISSYKFRAFLNTRIALAK